MKKLMVVLLLIPQLCFAQSTLRKIRIDDGAGNDRQANVTASNELTVLDSNSSDLKTAAEIIDDWDESDRAKVNPIAGQAGIAAGTGVDGVTVPRVTLATDVALPAGTNALGIVKTHLLAVSLGNISGQTKENKFGSNPAVGTSSETVWDGGAAYNWLSSAQTINITSSSAADDGDPAGTGALTVTIYGLDSSYNLQNETVTMNGQTIVTTSNTYIRIYRMIVATEGSGASANVGDIYAFTGTATAGVPDTATQIYAKIIVGFGQTLMTPYTVPAGKTAYLVSAFASSAAGKNAKVQIYARPFGGAKNIKFDFDILNSEFIKDYTVFPSFTAKTDIWVESYVDAGTTTVSAGFDLLLVDN